ncbi:MAG: M20/M25/M40 family metallo-hydrolase [Candidatus Zixiibacteriota bacterium]
MRRGILSAAVIASLATAALALPGDLVVLSEREIRPSEAAGLYYLGVCSAGYLYSGSAAALGAVSPYSILERDAELKDYYVVWAPEWVGVTPEAFAPLGTAVRLSDDEILVGLERGPGAGAIRAVEHRVELRHLTPITPIDFEIDAEEPPTEKDPRVEAAVNTITAEEYAGYIRTLQDFGTRYTDLKGFEYARDYLKAFFRTQNLYVSAFPFEYNTFRDVTYAAPSGKIYALTFAVTVHRSADGGGNWDVVAPDGVINAMDFFWVDGEIGFVAGHYNNNLSKTRDGGQSWETVEIYAGVPNQVYYVSDMHFPNADSGWLAGYVAKTGQQGMRGYIMKTDDGGANWVEQPLPTEAVITSLDFYDGLHGWAGGKDGGIVYTDNGGSTWYEASSPPAAEIKDIAAIGVREAWAATDAGELLHTADGVTWIKVDPGVEGYFYQVEFPTSRNGYAGGNKLMITRDRGETWREIDGAPEMTYDFISFAGENDGVFADETADNIFVTDDGGGSFADIRSNMRLHSENVIGESPGTISPDEIVVIGGHFDSLAIPGISQAPGADDNASGTACVMAAARALKDYKFERTIRYVTFGAEELGLKGSVAYADYCAERGENIVAVLNADMVSYDEENGGRDDLTVGAPDDDAWLVEYLGAVGGLYGQNLIYDWDGTGVSDDWPFADVGYPALGVIEGEVGEGGSQGYPWYHTTEDTLDKIQPEFGARCARDLAATVAHLAGVSDTLFEPTPPGHEAVGPFARAFAVYPNPYCYASTASAGVTFVGLKTPAKVEVYDLAGRRVARWDVAAGTDECAWCPAGSGEGALAPGVYVYRVEGVEQEKSGKIVIAR